MNLEHRKNKQAIRSFMQNHYSDERLVMLLAHAKDGKLNFSSCCCFIGIATANHTLQTIDRCSMVGVVSDHLIEAKLLSGAIAAETAFLSMGEGVDKRARNAKRSRILIPIIRSEMKRRDAARKQIEWKQELVEMST